MTDRRLLIPGFRKLLHGGDYNPDQWLKTPDIIDEDFRLMKLAHCNTFTVGVFAWTSYEREEGVFDFSWLDRMMDRMAAAGHRVILATPSGAKPAWLSQKYPEVRRVARNGQRDPHFGRHNHCMTSPIYRQKVAELNGRLAERYAAHPALAMWHVSNEYSGECLCELCLSRFHDWLRARYGNVDALNEAWWTAFWSHTFTSFDQIDPRDGSIDSLKLDFKRYTSDIIIDFMRAELAALRRFSQAPATTNLIGMFAGIDYEKQVAELDLVADDQYPGYACNSPELERDVLRVAFKDDLHRSFKPDRPWLLMESCPDATQWQHPVQLKPSPLHRAEMLQALGHGAEGTCYFQWRKGRAGSEKLHGAVVDHVGHEHTRVFASVAELGAGYERLTEIIGSRNESEVAVIYDWQVRWAFDASEGVRSDNDAWSVGVRGTDAYAATCLDHYAPFARNGVSVDVLGAGRDFSGYKLVIAPQLWMLAPGVAERVARFVEAGGTFVTTYYSGYCDQNNRCFLGGFPGDGLMQVLGIWNDETDWLPRHSSRRVRSRSEAGELGLAGEYAAEELCALVHLRGATSLLDYAEDFYEGRPALTRNNFGKGVAYYQAARLASPFLDHFYGALITRLGLQRALGAQLPPGFAAQRRVSADYEYLFLQNFSREERRLALPPSSYFDLLAQRPLDGGVRLAAWDSTVLRRPRSGAHP
jgi:beta-galactosidase